MISFDGGTEETAEPRERPAVRSRRRRGVRRYELDRVDRYALAHGGEPDRTRDAVAEKQHRWDVPACLVFPYYEHGDCYSVLDTWPRRSALDQKIEVACTVWISLLRDSNRITDGAHLDQGRVLR